MLVIRLGVLSVATTCLFGQSPSPPKKAAAPVKRVRRFFINPTGFRDEQCLRDILAAQAAGGIDGRKRLAEAAAVGCTWSEGGVYLLGRYSTPPPIFSQGRTIRYIKGTLGRVDEASDDLGTGIGDSFIDGILVLDAQTEINEAKLEALITAASDEAQKAAAQEAADKDWRKALGDWILSPFGLATVGNFQPLTTLRNPRARHACAEVISVRVGQDEQSRLTMRVEARNTSASICILDFDVEVQDRNFGKPFTRTVALGVLKSEESAVRHAVLERYPRKAEELELKILDPKP